MDNENEKNYFGENMKIMEEQIDETDRHKKSPENCPQTAIVLKPDHPLMQKFQTALYSFLQKENERVGIEILELRENLKKERREYEKQMSHELYNFEKEISQQRNLMCEFEEKLDVIRKNHEEKDCMIKLQRDSYKKHYETLNTNKKKNTQLCGELEALTLLCKQYELWEKDINSELAIHQRISEKISSDKLQSIEEKKKMDIMVYKLKTEVWNLESEISLIDDQTQIKLNEMDAIKNRIANCSSDRQALDVEQQRLLQLWNSAVINIQQKDKMLTMINQEYEDAQMKFKTLIQNIEIIKKETDDEMRRHESLIIIKNKNNMEIMECSKAVDFEERRRNNLETTLLEINSALEITEKDLQSENIKYSKNQKNIKTVILQYEKLATEKINLENETLDKLQCRLNKDKTVEDLATKIKQLKADTVRNEVNMLNCENQLSKLTLKIEKQRFINSHKQTTTNEEKNIYEKKQYILQATENKLKETLCAIEKHQTLLDVTNKKIDQILHKNEGNEISPIERKINELENQIRDRTMASEEYRKIWIRMQKHVIQLTKKNQTQILENEIIQQQTQVMEYKLLKLKDHVTKQKDDNINLQRLIGAELHKIEHLSKEKCKNILKNNILQGKYDSFTMENMAKLKDIEMQLMTIKEKISQLENDKEQLAIELDKIERNIKYWKKMEILASETKQKVKEEKSATGEIGRMKMEIHRMQVRQAQVARTAGRLASDLAQAVGRRAAAVNRSRAITQNAIPKYTFSSKNKEKRNDIHRITQEIEINQNKIQTMKDEESVLKKNAQEKKIIIATLENEIAKLKHQINEDYFNKQANLEKIIRNQRYGQHCAMVLSGHIRIHSVKSESIISMKYNKEIKINSQLINLVRSLIKEIPEYQAILTRILNTLSICDE